MKSKTEKYLKKYLKKKQHKNMIKGFVKKAEKHGKWKELKSRKKKENLKIW